MCYQKARDQKTGPKISVLRMHEVVNSHRIPTEGFCHRIYWRTQIILYACKVIKYIRANITKVEHSVRPNIYEIEIDILHCKTLKLVIIELGNHQNWGLSKLVIIKVYVHQTYYLVVIKVGDDQSW